MQRQQILLWKLFHFHSIFNRDKPGLSDAAVPDALADAELQFADRVPTGTYLDMCANLPVVGSMPAFWPLHDSPRFRAIVEGMGLPLLQGSSD